MRKRIFFTILGLSVLGHLFSQTAWITPWMDYKRAALSITIDDNNFSAQAPLDARGLKGTFFLITNGVSWNSAKNAYLAGHEVASHTVNHVNLGTLYTAGDTAGIVSELKRSHDSILTHFPNQKYLSFAYPYGTGWENSASATEIRKFVKRYYINARGIAGAAGNSDIPGFDKYIDYKYFPDYYYQTGGWGIDDNTTIISYRNTLKSAINAGGWAIFLYHNPPAAFAQQLDTVSNYKSSLWITTFGGATRYHKERNTASITQAGINDSVWTYSLTDKMAPDTVYNHPLTIRLKIPYNIQVTRIEQNSQNLSFQMLDSVVQFNAVPDNGLIKVFKKDLNYNGCDSLKLTAPANLTYKVMSSSQVILNWDLLPDAACVKGYLIYQDDVLLNTVLQNSYAISGLNSQKTYKFYIKAKNYQNKISLSSNVITVRLDTVAPSVPQRVRVVQVNTGTVNLCWGPASDNISIAGYKIYVNSQLKTTSNDTCIVIGGLSSGSVYSFSVKAFDEAGNQSASSKSVNLKVTGISDRNDELNVYPNPFVHNCYIDLSVFGAEPVTVNVMDAQGHQVSSGIFSAGVWFGENLIPGLYFIQIINNKSIISKIILKE